MVTIVERVRRLLNPNQVRAAHFAIVPLALIAVPGAILIGIISFESLARSFGIEGLLVGVRPCNTAVLQNETEASGVGKKYLFERYQPGVFAITLVDWKKFETDNFAAIHWELQFQVDKGARGGNRFSLSKMNTFLIVNICGDVLHESNTSAAKEQ